MGRRLVERGHRVTVYCRRSAGKDATPLAEHLGMDLVHLPAVRRRSLETLSHTGLSVGHLLRHRPDVALLFNAANAPYLPALRAARVPVATHVDGLEWRRAKWSGLGQRYYKGVERLSVWWSDALIADAPGIADYYSTKFDAPTTQIAYGAPITDGSTHRLNDLGLKPEEFHLVVARFEPENHVDMIVRGYVQSDARLPLVVVGSAPYSDEHTAAIKAASDERVRFLGGVWDQELLDQLYSGARTYLHGHSVGGTNPSLLRAIGAGAAVLAYDVNFNHDVLGAAGRYFGGDADVASLVESAEGDVEATREQGRQARERATHYDWDDVTDRYEALCLELARSPKSAVQPA
ncbi:Alpha-D-GlcNAc alpha-1,2-L-rhamnosyltransferase [Serinicoccus hydrothermalis]|uniref:Alpha-D-GlcNAc alpha-1,2-L-rhamnosyltransferase n=1 Tax=Serinicoccus hydrothermalis TaxID=1758689 RepID=A0A1B1NEK7_9MICO|nr:Alpha-D-GlcNAc alpha-1,2-L-rhamnosyltransferase [Serinicoccus hydrothermalis]